MPYRELLVLTLLTLSVIGVLTIRLAFSPDLSTPAYIVWWLFLVLMPVALSSIVLMGWTWAAMASVVYGTIGLAVDLATVFSILGKPDGSHLKLMLSILSGSANVLLIVLGGRAFWKAFGEPRPPGSPPPSPPSPASS
jgi:hypothetical protein